MDCGRNLCGGVSAGADWGWSAFDIGDGNWNGAGGGGFRFVLLRGEAFGAQETRGACGVDGENRIDSGGDVQVCAASAVFRDDIGGFGRVFVGRDEIRMDCGWRLVRDGDGNDIFGGAGNAGAVWAGV